MIAGRLRSRPGKRQVEIAGGVDPLLQPERLADGLHQVVRHLLAVAVGGAGDAEAALRMPAQMVEPLAGQRGFRLEIAVEIGLSGFDMGPFKAGKIMCTLRQGMCTSSGER